MENTAKQNKKAAKLRRCEFTRAFCANNKGRFCVTVAMLLITSLLYVGLAYILQRVMDIAAGGTTEELLQMVVVICGYVALWFITSLVSRKANYDYLERAAKQYKSHAFSRILNKGMAAFCGEASGNYISALTNDVDSINTNYLETTFTIISNAVLFCAALTMMLLYNPLMTLVAIALCALPVVLTVMLGGKLAMMETMVSEKNAGFVATVKDLLNGFSVVKSFGAEKEVSELFAQNDTELEAAKKKRRRTVKLINIATELSGFIVQFGVFGFGAYLALKGDITSGVVVAFVQLMNYILMPIKEIPAALANRKAAIALIDKLAISAEENTKRSGDKRIENIGAGIRVENVTFAYDSDEPILKDVSVEFETGKSYAIVGPSGSGKSTLLNLLLGVADDYSGEIHMDGAELRDISTDSLYDTLSIIQQNVFVFNSSIEKNITMFKSFDKSAIESAARRAGLKGIMDEKGADYLCGENGSALSGGEKQRVSIARCLLKNTPVLLMDEATAALDAKTARDVTDAILDIDGLTRIIVTHRLEESLLRRYDEIVVIKDGRIVQKGGFDELLLQSGCFKSLYSVAA